MPPRPGALSRCSVNTSRRTEHWALSRYSEYLLDLKDREGLGHSVGTQSTPAEGLSLRSHSASLCHILLHEAVTKSPQVQEEEEQSLSFVGEESHRHVGLKVLLYL